MSDAHVELELDAALDAGPLEMRDASDVMLPDASALDAATELDAADTEDAGVDPSVDASTGACSGAGILGCYDFETGSTTPAVDPKWLGTTYRDTSRASAGASSLRIEDGNYVVQQTVGTALTSGNLYLRAHFYLPSSTPSEDWIVLMEAKPANEVSKVSFNWLPAFRSGLHAVARSTSGPESSLPTGRWFCASLAIEIGTNGSAVLAVDGVATYSFSGEDTTFGGQGIAFVRFGLIAPDVQTPVSINVDEAAFGTEPLPCP